jgi:hypothetical protein
VLQYLHLQEVPVCFDCVICQKTVSNVCMPFHIPFESISGGNLSFCRDVSLRSTFCCSVNTLRGSVFQAMSASCWGLYQLRIIYVKIHSSFFWGETIDRTHNLQACAKACLLPPSWRSLIAFMMEAVSTSETSVSWSETTRHYIPPPQLLASGVIQMVSWNKTTASEKVASLRQ